ncbi:histidine phosphatase family protein [Halosimplex litoreum]|uniref:Histidine phosphatase family protein n=1 Tax=Halosimplex litoreum TaxID=1198301 RepID=A0A7T3G1L3_9EURY|nr:histidine phosphatase family protein [Halosimplex litoreum]QPV64268.1 histidine phosphatase family protein [Halosimplex litoreum]
MATIVATRHGETTWNRKQRLQGWAPAPLTDLGREQAHQLGAALTENYDIDRVLSSDLYRTEETVEILLDHFDAPVTFESAWRERDIGVYQGLQFDEMSERFPEHDLEETGSEAAHRRAESGESLMDVHDRVIEQWETTLAECESSETILIVTHGGPIRLLLGKLKDIDIVESIMEQSQGYCSINEFEFDHETGAVRIVSENDTRHC